MSSLPYHNGVTSLLPAEFSIVNGTEVTCLFGRGRVVEVRSQCGQVKVRLTSWQLRHPDCVDTADSSQLGSFLARQVEQCVTCYMNIDAVRVLEPTPVSDLSLFEALVYTHERQHSGAQWENLIRSKMSRHSLADTDHCLMMVLDCYQQACSACRVWHNRKIINANLSWPPANCFRAHFLTVDIKCTNRAAVCALHFGFYKLALKHSTDALRLLKLLDNKHQVYKKKQTKSQYNSTSENKKSVDQTPPLDLLGYSEIQVFGVWRVKSLIVTAQALWQAGRTRSTPVIQRAMAIIEKYTNGTDSRSGLPIKRPVEQLTRRGEKEQILKMTPVYSKMVRRLWRHKRTLERLVKQMKQFTESKATDGGSDVSNSDKHVILSSTVNDDSSDSHLTSSAHSSTTASCSDPCLAVINYDDEDDDEDDDHHHIQNKLKTNGIDSPLSPGSIATGITSSTFDETVSSLDFSSAQTLLQNRLTEHDEVTGTAFKVTIGNESNFVLSFRPQDQKANRTTGRQTLSLPFTNAESCQSSATLESDTSENSILVSNVSELRMTHSRSPDSFYKMTQSRSEARDASYYDNDRCNTPYLEVKLAKEAKLPGKSISSPVIWNAKDDSASIQKVEMNLPAYYVDDDAWRASLKPFVPHLRPTVSGVISDDSSYLNTSPPSHSRSKTEIKKPQQCVSFSDQLCVYTHTSSTPTSQQSYCHMDGVDNDTKASDVSNDKDNDDDNDSSDDDDFCNRFSSLPDWTTEGRWYQTPEFLVGVGALIAGGVTLTFVARQLKRPSSQQ